MQHAVNPLAGLAAFSSGVQVDSCPDAVVVKARALLLYGLAVGAASAAAPGLACVMAALRAEYGPEGSATCLIDGSRMGLGGAAFCNAVLCHTRIQDDAHPAGHMGTVILPAALALGETRACSGTELLAALISGYEVSLRIGRDHATDLSVRGFRTTPIYGAFGAAAACARLLRLDAVRTLHALALTTHGAAGLREFADSGTDEYPFQAGVAARNGITSALLAAEGVVGTPTALTGRAGLYRAYGLPDKNYAHRLLAGLGGDFELEKVTYKPYPGGQFHRGVIRGFAALRAHAKGREIESAQVHMHPFEAGYLGLNHKGPFQTYSQAFFSVPFCAALAWLHGTVTFEALHRFDDTAVLSIVEGIAVVSDVSRERYKPFIRVVLKDGVTLEWQDDAGEQGYELTWSAATAMAHALCAEAGVSDAKCTALIDVVAHIETLSTVTPLVSTARAVAAAIAPKNQAV